MCLKRPMTSVPNVTQGTDDVCPECARCLSIKYNFFSVDNPYLGARGLSLRRMYVHTLNPFCVISWACSAFRIMALGLATSRQTSKTTQDRCEQRVTEITVRHGLWRGDYMTHMEDNVLNNTASSISIGRLRVWLIRYKVE